MTQQLTRAQRRAKPNRHLACIICRQHVAPRDLVSFERKDTTYAAHAKCAEERSRLEAALGHEMDLLPKAKPPQITAAQDDHQWMHATLFEALLGLSDPTRR